jgi:hypothetical protein
MYNCTLIVSTFDGFEKVWKPFSVLFEKYWPDCPFDMVPITNYKDFPIGRTFKVGDDKGWSNNIEKVLKGINTKYVLYMQEDYLLQSKVDTKEILSLFNKMLLINADYLRLVPIPLPDIKSHPEMGLIKHTSKSINSLQCSFWRRSTFYNLLRQDETGWDFEIKGAKRVESGTFMCTHKHSIDYVWGVVKGNWTQEAIKLLEKENISVVPGRKIND